MSKLFRNKRDGWLTLRDLIRSGEEFHNSTGSFRGIRRESLGSPSVGHLPEKDAAWFRQCDAMGILTYVVYSYQTPIAWRTDNAWYIPDARYSVTTSQHQGLIRTAVDQL